MYPINYTKSSCRWGWKCMFFFSSLQQIMKCCTNELAKVPNYFSFSLCAQNSKLIKCYVLRLTMDDFFFFCRSFVHWKINLLWTFLLFLIVAKCNLSQEYNIFVFFFICMTMLSMHSNINVKIGRWKFVVQTFHVEILFHNVLVIVIPIWWCVCVFIFQISLP